MAFAAAAEYALWRVAAPRAVDEAATSLQLPASGRRAMDVGFDQVWQTLKTMYYATGPSAAAWDALRDEVPAACRASEGRRVRRRRHRRDDRGTAAHQAGRRVLARGRRVGQPARVAGGRADAREGRQRRRRRHRRGVRARRRRARCDERRRRRPGDSVPQGHDRAGRHRIQGHDAGACDARQPEALHADGRAHGERWTVGREHSRRRRGARPAVSEVRQQESGVGGLDRAGDQARRRGLRARRGAADVDRRGARVVREVPGSREDLPARRQGAAAGDRFVNKDYAETLRTLAKEGGAVVLSRVARAQDRRRHGRERRRDHARRSRAVPRDGAQAAGRALPRPRGLLGAAAGVERRADGRDAEHPRQLPAAPGRDLHDRRRLPPLRDRSVARARRRRPHRGSRALAGRSRQSPRAGARARAVQADRSEEGVHGSGWWTGRPGLRLRLRRGRLLIRLPVRRRIRPHPDRAPRRSSSRTPKAT